jgi:arabinose-5-phosphate isomerase
MNDAVQAARRSLDAQIFGLQSLSAGLGDSFAQAVALITEMRGRVIVTGVGKSGHIGAKIAATMASTGTRAQFVHAAEASHGDLGMIDPDDIVIALSKSGESAELGDIIGYCKRFSIPLIAITAGVTSTLGQAATLVLVLPDVPEATSNIAAPTTSTTMTLALGDALAVALLEARGFGPEDFRAFHPGGKLGARLLAVKDLMHSGDAMPIVAPTTPAADVLITMSAKRLGCAGVVADGVLVGVITDGDVRRHADGLLSHTAAELMNTSPKTIAPATLAAEALALMNTHSITTLFTCDTAGKPQGVLHLHDVLRAGVA